MLNNRDDRFFTLWLNQSTKLLESHIEKKFHKAPPHQNDLYKAAKHALHSGKRLRPLLFLATVDSFSLKKNFLNSIRLHSPSLQKALFSKNRASLDVALSLELIHTYSLIHDDLPCMDNDDTRRGLPTLHKVFPEWMALLCGDFLLTYAFDLLANAPNIKDDQKVELIKTLSKQSGSEGMIGGQVVDLEAKEAKVGEDVLEFLHIHKTAALFMASVDFGSIVCNLSSKERKILVSFAKTLGFAYQLVDDLLDEEKQEKSSALWVLGKEKTKQKIDLLEKKALSLLKQLKPYPILLEKLLKKLLHRSF
jgi:geranylgeranyl diphosphate synthase type II